ncbi:Leucine-rich_repeat domain superfamily [Hexamita inflata]|uniref:Leucine-rich repeat domain superfamily n=1 Tax=Hexamita inflata TaxID=28002 RepID=A0AA86ULJ8_9EUKA|nr:Leucine-rich repeat domain superfamily [Hexamita inflata]
MKLNQVTIFNSTQIYNDFEFNIWGWFLISTKVYTTLHDQELRDLRFVSELGVTDLRLCNCQNARTLREPANLRAFAHYSSALKTAKGVERLVGLELLYLGENQIVELNIRGLDKLKDLYVLRNKIRDLSGAEYLKAKGCCQKYCRIENQKQSSQEEIDEARLW